MDLRDGSWWWQYGLDGIVGGIVGGAVTAIAVWLTLRHERTLARDTEVEQRHVEMRSRVADLQVAALQATLIPWGANEAAWRRMYEDVFRAVLLTEPVARAFAPALARDLESFREFLVTGWWLPEDELVDRADGTVAQFGLDPRVVKCSCAKLTVRLHAWIAHPRRYEADVPKVTNWNERADDPVLNELVATEWTSD